MADPVLIAQTADEQSEENYDTSDPGQVNKARKRSARTRADRLKFVAAAMGHEEGRAWFYDILLRCHTFRMSFVAGDPHATSFKCGEQNIGFQILDDIQIAAPNQYIQMITENKNRNG